MAAKKKAPRKAVAKRKATAKVRAVRSPRAATRGMARDDGNATLLERLRSALPAELEMIRKALALDPGAAPETIAREFREVAGNSFANVVRGGEATFGKLAASLLMVSTLPASLLAGGMTAREGPSYHRVLVDVADKLKPGVGWTAFNTENSAVRDLEDAVWTFAIDRCKERLAKLSHDQRRDFDAKLNAELAKAGVSPKARGVIAGLSGLAGTAAVTTTAATPLALALFYKGLFGGLYAAIFGVSNMAFFASAGVLAAPVALLTVGAWLASPSYSKTIPVTLTLIAVRLRVEGEEQIKAVAP